MEISNDIARNQTQDLTIYRAWLYHYKMSYCSAQWSEKPDHITFYKKNQKSFLIFGNGAIWVSLFYIRIFWEVESIFGQNVAAPAIDRGYNQHISASF